jgi:diguanylate cyclase (GGDEF)-like protein
MGIIDGDSEVQRLFNATLNGMLHGFSLWSEDWRLLLWNDRYHEIYDFPLGSLKKGMTIVEACQVSVSRGHGGGKTAKELADNYLARVAAGIFHETFIRDRTVKLTHRHMPGVGWAITHEDVAEQNEKSRMLQQREEELRLQHIRLKAAVNNISQGLSMFDADERLVICNNRYAEIYGLPPELIMPGTPHADIVSYRLDHGMRPIDGSEAFLEKHRAMMASAVTGVVTVETSDGRMIAITHHPMSDGGWVATHQDVTEQRESEARIRQLARQDPLTDLPNRMCFLEHMERAEAGLRRGEQMAVLYVDLDRFKPINDTFGHAAGDAVLIEVSRRLSDCCRGVDVAARLGGDEFAVLIGPLKKADDAAPLASRIVDVLARPFAVEGEMMKIGASVGIAMGPSDGLNADTLMKAADLALYRAKSTGGGRACFYDQAMDSVRAA